MAQVAHHPPAPAPAPAHTSSSPTTSKTTARIPFPPLPSISITGADSDSTSHSDNPLDLESEYEYEDNVIQSRSGTPTQERPGRRYSYIEPSPPCATTTQARVQLQQAPAKPAMSSALPLSGARGEGETGAKVQKRVSFPDLPAIAESSPEGAKAVRTDASSQVPRPSTDSMASLGAGSEDEDDGVRRPSMEEILPRGMDMRGALAKCEDPRLGWSLQFWITIVDPLTNHAFFACPATGQTSWTPPTGVFIVPRQAEGEWWELADTTRGNRSYFYNTLTKETQWTRPGGDAFVIPLGLIQSATLPKRGSGESDSGSGSASGRHGTADDSSVAIAKTATTTTGSRNNKQPQRQDSIQIHHKGMSKKRSKQTLRSSTSTETIKPTSKHADREKGRSRAATVTIATGSGARLGSIDVIAKPLPSPPSTAGAGDAEMDDLPAHPGIPGISGSASRRVGGGASTPTSPFGNRISLPPGSPSTPTRSTHPRSPSTPSTPTPKTSKLARSTTNSVNGIDYTNLSPPLTPQTPESDRTTTTAHRRLRPLSVVGEELSGNEADDSSVSEVERDEVSEGKVYSAEKGSTPGKRESLFSRRRLSSLSFGVLGRAPDRDGAPPVPRRGSSLSITSISAPSPLSTSAIDLRTIGGSSLTPTVSPSTFRMVSGNRSKDASVAYSPILAKAKIHIEPSSRPIPIVPTFSSVDLTLSSGSALGFAPATGTGTATADGMRTKRFSTGPHPLVPRTISTEIHAFQLDTFAEQYFAKRRTGFMRTRVPLSRLLTWQKLPITAPLLEATSKSYAKEAVVAFKVIQRAMCERDKPVEGARPMRANGLAELESMPGYKTAGFGSPAPDLGSPRHQGAANSYAGEAKAGTGKVQVQGNWVTVGNGVEDEMGYGQDANMQILEEVRWMIQIAVFAPEMRDEVYAQVVKQLTGNQSLSTMVLGFQLLCVMVNAFSPSPHFEPFVRDFLARHIEQNIRGIGIMALYCQNKLDSNRKLSTRARPLTIGEIEHASDAAFYPSIYGDSLIAIMQRQATTFSGPPRNPSHNLGQAEPGAVAKSSRTLNVPVILPFLAKAILQLGGDRAEGIFRVPGDAEVVAELKSRMDRGHYQLAGITDPHVAASLFKLFLRELAEPVVPNHMYNEALESSSTPEEAVAFLRTLPQAHRRVLVFVIFFTRRFCADEVVKATKMTPSNLALVLAPNILRTTSDSLVTVYTNAAFESKWILTLLQALKKEDLDKADWPEEDF